MDISGVSTPAVPDFRQEPPRDAESQTAVREPSESEPQQNNTQSDSSPRRDESSNVGRNIDEHA